MKLDTYYYSSIGGRKENEDAVELRENSAGAVAVLADGLGGQGDGSIASRTICESLIKLGADGGFPSGESLTAAFEKANAELIAKQTNRFHMKTTAVYLCVHDDRAVWAHVGDSRLYHVHNGLLCHYTLDHSASQLAVYLGQITRKEIPQDPGRNRLLRALGVEGEKADVHDAVPLDRGRHAFLLCSDGLWEYLSDEEITAICSRNLSAKEMLGTMVKLKNQRCAQNCDNNSAILILAER